MNILICEDHDIIISGIASLISASGMQFQMDGVSNRKDTLKFLQNKNYDLLILDISLQDPNGNHLKDEDGIELLKDIRPRWPEIKVLMISMHDENYMIHTSFDYGALGYLHKNFVNQELINAIQTVMRGERYLSPHLQKKYDTFLFNFKRSPSQILTQCELTLAFDFISGLTDKEICIKSSRKESTIRNHRSSIYRKLGVNTIPQVKNIFQAHKLL